VKSESLPGTPPQLNKNIYASVTKVESNQDKFAYPGQEKETSEKENSENEEPELPDPQEIENENLQK